MKNVKLFGTALLLILIGMILGKSFSTPICIIIVVPIWFLWFAIYDNKKYTKVESKKYYQGGVYK